MLSEDFLTMNDLSLRYFSLIILRLERYYYEYIYISFHFAKWYCLFLHKLFYAEERKQESKSSKRVKDLRYSQQPLQIDQAVLFRACKIFSVFITVHTATTVT